MRNLSQFDIDSLIGLVSGIGIIIIFLSLGIQW